MNIYLLNALVSGTDIVTSLAREVNIKGIIGLSKRTPTDVISGYVHLEEFCRGRYEFVQVETYDLKGESDQKRLLALDIDLLLVLGWQRLIPEWLIKHCKVGVVGAHGSPFGITRGRGRSPQNWALILGRRRFYVSIYFIDPGIDSGPVIDTMKYSLGLYDDIRTSYYKSGELISAMIIRNLKNGRILSHKGRAQHGLPTYLPKRLPEDGEIDWRRSTMQIYNFVRALTRPYPGAFSPLSGGKLVVWRARPFNIPRRDHAPGKIIKKFCNGDFVVETKDGAILIDDYELIHDPDETKLLEEAILPSCDFKDQIRKIIDRHYKQFPRLSVHPQILRLARHI